ncbi:LuxR C-terminal-related transcriptional regulator [Roseimaritima ulvae]|uniref:Bacterial regulatory protein, luxR family n=1 Tax=Roseimaritima ulvae TaxID=980254 RepID=A0A5B9QU33_9BACT|nr:LuxR C-terminal-related transcriptional regulator [Roseimaritima ulvae]QEG42548.1 Bacterial regulatory protein, luxR family [Roseimaritima ulvae]
MVSPRCLLVLLALLGIAWADAPQAMANVAVSHSPAMAESRTLVQIQNYGIASFRNAGVPASEWSDCAQQLVVEMLQRCPRRNLPAAVAGSQETSRGELTRRELNRSVWRIVKRWKRQRHPRSLDGNAALQQRAINDRRRRGWTLDELAELPGAELSERQTKILRLLCLGYSHDEIAAELDIAKPKISHEKYRAVQKLRKAWLQNEQVS